MALIALTTTIIVPSFSGVLASFKVNADTRKMASVLKLARQEAIMTGQPRTVVFYPGIQKYKINGESTYLLSPGVNFIGTTTFPKGGNGLPSCGFSPSGAPSSGGTVTLGNGSEKLYLIVNPVAGRIRISKTPPENW
jgi:general secretion pathway protein H